MFIILGIKIVFWIWNFDKSKEANLYYKDVFPDYTVAPSGKVIAKILLLTNF